MVLQKESLTLYMDIISSPKEERKHKFMDIISFLATTDREGIKLIAYDLDSLYELVNRDIRENEEFQGELHSVITQFYNDKDYKKPSIETLIEIALDRDIIADRKERQENLLS